MSQANKRKDIKATEEVIQQVSSDPGYIQSLIVTLGCKSTDRFAAAKKLQLISRVKPSVLYAYFEVFEKLLNSTSSVLLWNSIIILSHLVLVDVDKRFDNICDTYYSHLWDGKLVTAANILGSSGRIARCRPDLVENITAELLKVDDIPLPTAECREVARGHVLSSFAEYPAILKTHKAAYDFIVRCTRSHRLTVKKQAEELLNRIG